MIHFLSQGRSERKRFFLGGAVAVLQSILEITFFPLPLLKRSYFWRFFATEAFIYCMMDTILGMHVEGTIRNLFFQRKFISPQKKTFPKYLLYQRFFLYVLVIFSFFYDVDMDKISR